MKPSLEVCLCHIALHPDSFRSDFQAWLVDNLHVYAEFERRALEVAVKRVHYSARIIAEVIRHDTAIGQLFGDFKIDGNFVPDLGRMFMYCHPRYDNFFESRERKAAA